MKPLTIYLDLDGVLCPDMHERFKEAWNKQRNDYISFINWMHDQGHKIIIFTSRGRKGEDKEAEEETVKMLNVWGVKYTDIDWTKPTYDLIVEDKGVASLDLLKKMFEKFTGEMFYDKY